MKNYSMQKGRKRNDNLKLAMKIALFIILASLVIILKLTYNNIPEIG